MLYIKNKEAPKLAHYGDRTLTILLVLAGVAIILFALFNHNVWLKALAFLYIVLP